MGGAASLFTDRPSMRDRCKYQLLHAVRVHHGADDESYKYEVLGAIFTFYP